MFISTFLANIRLLGALRFASACASVLGAIAIEASADSSHSTVSAPTSSDDRSDKSLELLMAGNVRFAEGKPLHPDQAEARRAEVAKGQHPVAVVLTCADSRVSPEIYFDRGLGDLFVIRNAGHVLNAHVLGSIEYAVAHLDAPLLFVVGHERCGAVSAAVGGGAVEGHVWDIVQSIQPAVQAARDLPGDAVDNAVRHHSRLTAQALCTSDPIIAAAVKAGRLTVKAARYDLDTGRVELLPEPTR